MASRVASLVRSVALGVLFALAADAGAFPFSGAVFFGDSLSDVGSGPAVPPTYGGRFSNGPLWNEQLPELLGLAPERVHQYGVAGARSDGANVGFPGGMGMGLADEIDLYLAAPPAAVDADALFVVWAGGNDGLVGFGDAAAAGALAADNIGTAVARLAASGAAHFLVPNLPNLGQVPLSALFDRVAFGTAFTAAFNAALPGVLADLEAAHGIDATLLDVGSLFDAALADPIAFGLENVTEGCISLFGSGDPCADPDVHLFWDEVHPTTRVHGEIARAAYVALVPEPGTIALLAVGIALLGARRW
jgi:phospholipase/lecithinase/hemolysin